MDYDPLGDLFGTTPPLNVEAFLRGDLQGRDRSRSGKDCRAVEEYLKNDWRLPDDEVDRRREALAAKQYAYFGSCPECEAEGAIYETPNKDDWMVCSTGCKVRWCVGSGTFGARPPEELSEDELEELVATLYEDYVEVSPLLGWKLDLL